MKTLKQVLLTILIILLAFIIIISCGDDDDSPTNSGQCGDDESDDDTSDDDISDDDDNTSDDDDNDNDATDDDQTDDDDADDDDDNDNDATDDDNTDDDDYSNDECDNDSECCANAWIICEYLFPYYTDECGDMPSYNDWPAYKAWSICSVESNSEYYSNRAQCGYERGCEDWQYERYLCLISNNDEYVQCYQNADDIFEYGDCVDALELPDCYAE